MIRVFSIASWAALFATPALAQPVQSGPGTFALGCGLHKLSPTIVHRNLVEASGSRAAFNLDLDASRRAIRSVNRLSREILAGKAATPPYHGAVRWMSLAKRAVSPELSHLYRRVAADQVSRLHFTAVLEQSNWAKGLSEHVRRYVYYFVSAKNCRIDEANTAWLKARIRRAGWFVVSQSGVEADQAAWLLVQHADRDPAFQAEVLKILEPLVPAKETSPASYAYLYDRVAVNAGGLQRYGTQGRCQPTGRWEEWGVEDPEGLDARRSGIGLPQQARYREMFSCGRVRNDK